MRWEDIVKNGDRCSIKLCNGAVDDGNSRRTKNRHDRLVPLHREIIERLDTYQHHEDGYIFHTPGSSRIYHGCVLKPLKNDVFPIAEKNLRDKGINSNVTKGCSHSFRHYICSQCVKQDMPQQVLQLIMGHKNSGMVRHYLHLHDEDIHDIIEKVKL